MADAKKYAAFLFPWEGRFVNDPLDHGGATNMGVTIATWRQCGYDKDGDGDIDVDDMKLLSLSDATMVMKKYYWDRWKADQINSQSVAMTLVEWVWGSGKWGIIIPQRILGLKEDGIVGPVTLSAVNAQPAQELFQKLQTAKIDFVEDIVRRDPSQARFIKGWKRRINGLKFTD